MAIIFKAPVTVGKYIKVEKGGVNYVVENGGKVINVGGANVPELDGEEGDLPTDVTSDFAQKYVVDPAQRRRVMDILHEQIDNQQKPKQVILPLRAAIETGYVTGNISPKDFIAEFGKLSVPSFYRWMKYEYEAYDLDPLIALFK